VIPCRARICLIESTNWVSDELITAWIFLSWSSSVGKEPNVIVVFFCFGAVGLHEFSGIETVSAAVLWMGVVTGVRQGTQLGNEMTGC
jgi:hypothetical protein